MFKEESVRTSLEVGFSESAPLPERFVRFRGKQMREIPVMEEFPFADSQFEVVMMAPTAVSQKLVKEAHRVLRPDGRLMFVVPERNGKQEGFSMPELYSVMRHGFDIVEMSRSPWWLFGIGGRKLVIQARKKNWRELNNTYRPYV